MKKLLKTLTVALALVAAPFVVWRLCDDPDRRKIEPLVGEWRATATDGMQRKYPLRQQEHNPPDCGSFFFRKAMSINDIPRV